MGKGNSFIYGSAVGAALGVVLAPRRGEFEEGDTVKVDLVDGSLAFTK